MSSKRECIPNIRKPNRKTLGELIKDSKKSGSIDVEDGKSPNKISK